MTDDTPERWLPIAGYKGLYEASDLGRVRSLDRIQRSRWGTPRQWRGRILRPVATTSSGYLQVTLYSGGDSPSRERQSVLSVHVLVLEAFSGPRPEGCEARHLDGDRHNNAAANLAWGTPEQNWEDRRSHGRDVNSAKTHCKHGHPFDEANTRIKRNPDGSFKARQCEACRGRGPYR